MRLAVLLGLALAIPVSIVAQTTTSIPTNTPFRLLADHDGVNTTAYRCYLGTTQVGADVPVASRTGNTVTCNIPGQTNPGTITVGVEAVNEFGASPRAEMTAQVGNPPGPVTPGTVRIEIIITVPQP